MMTHCVTRDNHNGHKNGNLSNKINENDYKNAHSNKDIPQKETTDESILQKETIFQKNTFLHVLNHKIPTIELYLHPIKIRIHLKLILRPQIILITTRFYF